MNISTRNPKGRVLISGTTTGPLLVSNTPLSFMGGVDPKTGLIIDQHHPLRDQSLSGKILALPCGRGSCSGSGVMLELLLSLEADSNEDKDKSPAPLALIFKKMEHILTLGVLVADLLFSKSIPVILIDDDTFSSLETGNHATITPTTLSLSLSSSTSISPIPLTPLPTPSTLRTLISLDPYELSLLTSPPTPAHHTAMLAILHYAHLHSATHLVPITRAHIDACYYCGPSTLLFARRLRDQGARFCVPTTLNAISVDRRRWRELGVEESFAGKAGEVADLYGGMGAEVEAGFSCAPYLSWVGGGGDDEHGGDGGGRGAPKLGEQIGWAESNAVVFANSVLGARTLKYPDFMDVFVGIVGRGVAVGCHVDEGRRPCVLVRVDGGLFKSGRVGSGGSDHGDDSFWPVLGHCIGDGVGGDIPLILGLEDTAPKIEDLKGFGAAFATTSSAAMFHIKGVTPEAHLYDQEEEDDNKKGTRLQTITITAKDLHRTHRSLNSATDPSLHLISLGNPHFSLQEFATLHSLCNTRSKHPNVQVTITTSRETYAKADARGYIKPLIEGFGANVITDTCWCMITEPIIPVGTRNLMTNSAKYAHYGPGLVRRGVHFGSLAECVDGACQGYWEYRVPGWLEEDGNGDNDGNVDD